MTLYIYMTYTYRIMIFIILRGTFLLITFQKISIIACDFYGGGLHKKLPGNKKYLGRPSTSIYFVNLRNVFGAFIFRLHWHITLAKKCFQFLKK